MLQNNTIAPDFSLLNQSGQNISLADFAGKNNVVLYFYPKDDTPGCTIEAQQFTALINDYTSNETVVVGVSKDDCGSHRDFINKYELKVELIADTSGELCEKYHVWQEKEKKGVKKMGIVRSTFIVDKKGNLVDVEYGVTADGHAQAVLEKIKNL
ncbi:MAG: peroxiredoxin [Gammaproteobacteria bacterium]|nr:peroxiredoxin [Gammaproteobacteria bacterium]